MSLFCVARSRIFAALRQSGNAAATASKSAATPPRENPEPEHAQVSFELTILINALHEPPRRTQQKK